MKVPGPQEPITQKDRPTPLMLAFMREQQAQIARLVAALKAAGTLPEDFE